MPHSNYVNISNIFQKGPDGFSATVCDVDSSYTSIPPRPDNPLILCFGCSFTYGSLDSKHRWIEGYPYQLSKITDYTVWNCAISGFGSWVHLALSKFLVEYSPDLIIFQIMQANRNPITTNECELVTLLSNRETIDSAFFNELHSINSVIWTRIAELEKYPDYRLMSFENMMEQDLDIINQLLNVYQCPFVFLIDRNGYPNALNNRYIIENYVKKRLLIGKNKKRTYLVETSFDGCLYKVSRKDYHPNLLRTQLTAFYLYRKICSTNILNNKNNS